MTILLITAFQAAETLAAFHRQRVEQTVGKRQNYHSDMAEICEADIDDIKQHLDDDSVSAENRAQAVRSGDVATAQRIIMQHLPPEWRALVGAAQAMEALAQAIADAMQAARGGA